MKLVVSFFTVIISIIIYIIFFPTKTEIHNNSNKNILITGGTGYIGSHICVDLLKNMININLIIIDNLCNSRYEVVNILQNTIDKSKNQHILFYKINIEDKIELDKIFTKVGKIDLVIHLAGLKSSVESMINPLTYYIANVESTISILHTMKKFNVTSIIFSSSAAVYGNCSIPPHKENNTLCPVTPYAKSKVYAEDIIKDWIISTKSKGIIFRYFNPIGAHISSLIGDTSKQRDSLMSNIIDVIKGKKEKLIIYNNKSTRDFIHIMDLSYVHLLAINRFDFIKCGEIEIYNIGRGIGITVDEIVETMVMVTGQIINVEMYTNRVGDVISSYGDVTNIKTIFNWAPKYSIFDMCKDTYNWELNIKL
jgi:UDP-glucose 4-epimerase